MKNLKKVLSALVVSALLTTSLVPAFAASQFTYEAEANTLHDLGLFLGVSTDPNVFNPALDQDVDRETGVTMMLRLVGKIDAANAMSDAEANQALSKYTDAKDIEDWAVKAMAYSVKNNLVVGTSETTISSQEIFSGKMFAALVLRNIGYTVDATAYETACALLAEKGGLTAAEAAKFNNKDLIRDDFVGMSYGSLKAKYSATQKTIIQTLVDEKKVDQAKAIAAGLITPAVAAISEVKAVGAKKLEVKFAAAVDPSKAALTVKKGSIAVNVANTTFAADNKSVVVELASKLTKGDYTVSVSGIAADALTKTITVEDEKVAKIEFPSDKAILDKDGDTKVTSSYKVLNQYGEDLTKSVDESSFTFTTSKGKITPLDGVLTIDTATFTKDDKITVNALYSGTTTFATTVLTVVEKALVADIAVTELYNEKNEALDITKDYSTYKLILEAKDQYGNKIPGDMIRVGSEVIVSVSNESVVKVGTITKETINGVEKTVLPLVAPSTKIAGTATVRIISTLNGHNASFEIVVKDKAKVDTINFQAPELAVAGETFEVPFTAVDQFGNEVKDAAKYGMEAFVPTFSDSNVTAKFSQDYVKGIPVLTVDATKITEAKSVVMSFLTPTNKFASLTLNIQAPAKAVVVGGTKDFNNKLLEGAVAKMTLDNVVVKDQYGRDMDVDTDVYKVAVATSNKDKVALETVAGTVYELSATNNTINFKAADKGSSTITLKVQKADGSDISGSEYTFTTTVVEKADIVSYELGDMGKIYDGGDYYGAEVKVYGKLADGSKVLVPYDETNNYKIFVGTAGVSNKAGTIVANGVNFDGKTNVEKDVAMIVTVIGANKTEVLSKKLVATNVAPEAATLELKSGDVVKVEGDKVVSIAYANYTTNLALAKDVLKVKDQYGKTMTLVTGTPANHSEVQATIIPTNVPETLKAGEFFNLTVVTDNAQVITFKVILK